MAVATDANWAVGLRERDAACLVLVITPAAMSSEGVGWGVQHVGPVIGGFLAGLILFGLVVLVFVVTGTLAIDAPRPGLHGTAALRAMSHCCCSAVSGGCWSRPARAAANSRRDQR